MNTTPTSEIKQMIDYAHKYKQWLVLVFHKIGDGDTEYSYPEKDFREIVEYVHIKGYIQGNVVSNSDI